MCPHETSSSAACAPFFDIFSFEPPRPQSTEASHLRHRRKTVCERGLTGQEGREERMPSSIVEGKSEPASLSRLESSHPKPSQNEQAAAFTAPVGPYSVGRKAKSTEHESNHLSRTSFVCFGGGIRRTYLILINYEWK